MSTSTMAHFHAPIFANLGRSSVSDSCLVSRLGSSTPENSKHSVSYVTKGEANGHNLVSKKHLKTNFLSSPFTHRRNLLTSDKKNSNGRFSKSVREKSRLNVLQKKRVCASLEYGDGDARVQQMLVEILRLQMGRVKLNDFVEERSQHMREIADQSDVELNRIANRTMKGVDKAGRRVLRELDAGAFAIERELEIARADIEAYERDCQEFEARAIYSRNEGLFFKNLYPMPKSMSYRKVYGKPVQKVKMEESSPSRKESVSTYRVIVYSGLSMVLMSFLWSASSALIIDGCTMKSTKFLAYMVIISLLVLQLRFEKEILGVEEDEKANQNSLEQ